MEHIDIGFETHKYQLDPGWIIEQLKREDCDDRITAFYESISNEISSDGEDWYVKGRDILIALLTNNATALLVALCGWGPDKLAQLALLKRSTSHFTTQTLDGKLIVEWDDGYRDATPCWIYSTKNLVYGFNHNIFIRDDNPNAHIVKTFVRFSLSHSGNEYDFLCVSKEERDRTEDEEIFWYDPDEEDEE